MSDEESRVELGRITITDLLIDGVQHVKVDFGGLPIYSVFSMLEMARMQAYASGLNIDDSDD